MLSEFYLEQIENDFARKIEEVLSEKWLLLSPEQIFNTVSFKLKKGNIK